MVLKGARLSRRRWLQNAAAVAGAAAVSLVLPDRVTNAIAQEPARPDQGAVQAAATWVSTTEGAAWQQRPLRAQGWRWDTLDAWVDLASAESTEPAIEGFGACFSELGWTSLQKLPEVQRDAIFKELFAPGEGANFTLCRMPVGANDFARGWYSYDETAGDFGMEHFSIANDMQTLVPFIQSAQRYNPSLELWASPWSPPSWMKRNGHYAAAIQRPGLPPNGLRPEQIGREGTDLFILEDKFLRAYALYFGRFIDAYREQGIRVGMVMPQNEFNSAQPFPSCTWTPAGLAQFLQVLGPEMARRNVEIFFGTLERGDPALLEAVLADPDARGYIKGVGVQWAGKGAVQTIHEEHPRLTIYQSEQECGDGKNDWSYAGYCWDLMKFYLRHGASGYMYWNIALERGGMSHWGWPQNSLITVDAAARTYSFNHEYYLLKHVSHFVQRGARRLNVEGTCDDALAFVNPDGSVAVVLRNEGPQERTVDVRIGGQTIAGSMPPDSFNTVLLRHVA
jgi:glucosylceramidase